MTKLSEIFSAQCWPRRGDYNFLTPRIIIISDVVIIAPINAPITNLNEFFPAQINTDNAPAYKVRLVKYRDTSIVCR